MKTLKITLFALSPFAIGYIINFILSTFFLGGRFFIPIGIIFLIYWFIVGYKAHEDQKHYLKALFAGNSFAILCYLLMQYQLTFLNRYYPNLIGTAPQMFYLPLIGISVRLIGYNLLKIIPVVTPGMLAFFSMLLMLVTFSLGYFYRASKRTQTPAYKKYRY